MSHRPLLRSLFAIAASAMALNAVGQSNWTMRGFDLNRNGYNGREITFNPSNINTGQFGRLFTRQVDGQIYSQPIVLQSVKIPNKGTHAVVFVATMHDSVYAFDADNPAAAEPLWKRSFIDEANGITTIPYQYLTGYPDIHPEVGIVSSPAIDTVNKTLFVVVRTVEGDPNNDSSYHQRLYALDYTTGAIKSGSPVELKASVAGTGDGNVNGVVSYDLRRENQRPALVLNKGKLYIASASHGDNGPYHGWVLGYDAQTLAPFGSFCTTPNAGLGGIWMSGHAMPVDADGNLYLATGNGGFDPSQGNFGDSVVKLNGSTLQVMDYFTPYNQDQLNQWDADLGSCGPVIIPGTNLVVTGSKEGKLYAASRTNMGHFNPSGDTNIFQWWWAANGHMHGSPVYFPGRKYLYIWSEDDHLKGFRLVNGKFETSPFAQSPMQAPPGMPGGFLTISGGTDNLDNAVVWATLPFSGNANWDTVPGVLRAFRASDLTELWNSHIVDEDDYGSFAKFNPPVVANGKVYVATFSNQLAVYGALPQVPPTAVGLTAEAGDGEVALTWKQSRGATSYEILRTATGGAEQKVADLSQAGFYLDQGLTDGTAYTYVVVAKNPYGTSDRSNPVTVTPAAVTLAKGTGASGNYYNDPDNGPHFGTLALQRVDKTIDFDWGGGSPATGIQTDHFSVVWCGQITPKQTGMYTFQSITDDGVRLWVRGKRVIDNWTDHAPTSDLSVPVLMVAGVKYSFQMEMYENGGGAVGRLLWSGPGIDGFQVVPTTNLFKMGDVPPPTDGVVDLGSQFNADGMSFATNPQDGDLGYLGQTFAAESMPSVISVSGTRPYRFVIGPLWNRANNVLQADGRTVPLPAFSALGVNLLACSVNGTQSGVFHLSYSDGSGADVSVSFTDWTAPSPRTGEVLAIRFPSRHSPTGDVIAKTSLYRYTIPADPGKRLVSITFPNNPNMKVLAMTLSR